MPACLSGSDGARELNPTPGTEDAPSTNQGVTINTRANATWHLVHTCAAIHAEGALFSLLLRVI